LQETDPIQKEMIRNREALKDATAAERGQIEGLITTIEMERQERERTAEMTDFARDAVGSLVTAAVRGGDEGANAMQRLLRTLEDIAIQALFVEPILKSLGLSEGGGGGGGFWGWLGGLFGFADGGFHYGPGSSRDDRKLVRVSPGEFHVNADATAKHRGLLEAINSGAPLPGFANGGAHGGAYAGTVQINQQFIDRTSGGVQMVTKEERQPDGSRLLIYELADAVGDVLTKPGTASQNAMRNAYGLSRRRALR
jgi:hypothetical protein